MKFYGKKDDDYLTWLRGVKDRYKSSQIKAAVQVNGEMLRFYFEVGKGISSLKNKKKWGSSFFEALSADLRSILPGIKGLSVKTFTTSKNFTRSSKRLNLSHKLWEK